MRIANNVELLEIRDERGLLCPVLTWDDHEIVLIDTGLPGQIDLIREAVSAAGFGLENISKVILTHQDMDHIGCAKILSELGAEILAHEEEAPYLQGDKTSVRIAAMESRLDELNEGERLFYERVKQGAPQFYVKVDRLLKDHETLDFCGGVQVIHTPGHMPGHIALLLRDSQFIVAGDAANIADGRLVGANPDHTQDMPLAQLSFQKMLDMHPKAVLCYHGGYIRCE